MDGLLNFLKQPEGQGLLGMVASYAANARRGAPVNSIGAGLLGGLGAYGAGLERQDMLAQKAKQDELRDLQMQQGRLSLEQQRAEAARREQGQAIFGGWVDQLNQATPQANNAVVTQTGGDLRPSPQNAALQTQAMGSILKDNPLANMPRGLVEMARVTGDHKPVIDFMLKSSMPGETPFAKVDPKDYTPASVARFKATGNHADLVPVRKLDVVNGRAVDLYGAQPGTVFDNIDPNRPFSLVGGQAVANTPYQQYELNRAKAGASKVTNDVRVGGETEYWKQRGKDSAELMTTINKNSFSAPAQLRKLERMEQLLAGVDGGKLAPTGMDIASAMNSFGIKIDPRLGNKEAAEALARELAGGLRVPGTGPMTDKDFENFLAQVPSLSKTAEGRKQITATMRAALARDMEVGKRARAYEKKNGTLDSGFLDEISQFIAENPVVKLPNQWKVER